MSEIDDLRATIEHLERRIQQLEQQPTRPPIGLSYPMTAHGDRQIGFHLVGRGRWMPDQPRLETDQ